MGVSCSCAAKSVTHVMQLEESDGNNENHVKSELNLESIRSESEIAVPKKLAALCEGETQGTTRRPSNPKSPMRNLSLRSMPLKDKVNYSDSNTNLHYNS